MQHKVSINEIENIFAKEHEKFEFIGKFKREVHLSFRGEDQFIRWTKLDQNMFLQALKIEGKLKRILFSNEIIVEVV